MKKTKSLTDTKPTFFMILLAVFVIIAALRILSPEDTWLCQKGEWVRHGRPSAPAPSHPCLP